MVDANARINVDINTADAIAQLRNLEKKIQFFNKSIVQGSSEAARLQNEFNSSLLHNINATGKFTASMSKVHTETERFTNALEKNKLSAREYFRYSMASTRTFGKLFGREFGTITKVAEERVKQLQARHIELGRAADGAMRAVKIVPNSLDYSKPLTQLQIAAQRQQIFNKLLDAGTTKLLNFGKNTQWAGRQLMVGFTIPLSILGSTALRVFRDLEMQAIRFKKVYGDIFTSTAETDAALQNIKNLASEFTKYGVSVADTIKLAADAAAAGNAGAQLESVVTQATKLSVLGGVAQEQALDATIAIQNAFGSTGKALDDSINFLNAVENQTIVALDDITQAIPKVAPVVTQLGGDIKDLAFFMAAMQEGGVKASEAANALKSGLASLINPTKAASEMAAQMGINLKGIVETNAGDLRATVMTFATALQPLDDLAKSRLIETIFGKYQFARLSTLFENVTKTGTQASRVLDLATSSTEELGIMAERELGITANSSAVKFQASVEKLKLSLVPLGQQFAEILTPIANFLTKALDRFNNFSEGTKHAITLVVAAIGGIGPVLLMTIGLIGNGIANILKGINFLRKGYQTLVGGGNELGLSTNYLTSEQLESLSVATSLHNAHSNLTSQFALEAGALAKLTSVYQQANTAAATFAANNPQFFLPGTGSKLNKPKFGKKMADGGWVPGTGNKDSVPTVLMPGEFVVNKKAAQSNAQTLERMNNGGQAYRATGTPGFGKVAYRGTGSGSQTDTISLVGHLQTSGLHLRQGTKKENGAYRYSGYTMLGNQSFNQLTQNRAAELRPILGGSDVEGYPLYRNEASNIVDLLKNRKDLTVNEKVALRTLQAELRQFPTGSSWQNEMSRRYALNVLAAEGLDPNSPQGKKLMDDMNKIFKTSASSSRNSNDLTSKLYSRADELWSKGVLGDKGMGIKNKMLPHKIYRGMPIVKLLGLINDPNLVRAQGKFGLTVPKFLNPQFDNAGNLVSVLGMPVKKQTSGVKSTQPSLGARARSMSQRPTFKWGARMGVAGAVGSMVATAAQALTQRQTGTPSYGEQGVTPAMVTPGEFIMNAKSAQKYGPALQAMNMGGNIKFRQDVTGPGYDPSFPSTESQMWNEKFKGNLVWSAKDPNNPTQEEIMQARNETNRQLGIKTPTSKVGKVVSSAGKVVAQAGKSAINAGLNKLADRLDNNSKVVQQNTNLTEDSNDTNKQSNKMAAKQRMSNAAGKIGGIGFAISGAAMAVGMTSEDRNTQELAGKISTVSGLIGGLTMALPMLMNPLTAFIIAIAGLVTASVLMKKAVDNARIKGFELAQSMSNTSEDLRGMGEMTGKVSASEAMLRRRQARISPINPLRSDFGDTFITSDLGKKLLAQTGELTKNNFGATSGEIIGSKLADYVVEGLIDPAQAQSIAEAIGSSLGSEDISLNINGKLQEIIGINGNDLYTNPLEVRVRLIEESKAQATEFANSVGNQLATINEAKSLFGFTGFFDSIFKGELPKLTYQLNAEIAKIAGQQVGYNTSLITTSQRALDSYDQQMLAQRQRFIEEEKALKTGIANTKNIKTQQELQVKLNELLGQRNSFENRYKEDRKEIVDQQKQALQFAIDTFNKNKQLQGDMVKASSTAVTEAYKGTPLEGIATIFNAQTEQFKNKEVTFLINTAVSSKGLGLEQAMGLVETMTGKDGKISEEGIQKQIQLYADTQGLEGLNRILLATSEVQDRFARGETINLFRDLEPEKFDKATSFLETATSLSNKDVNMTAVVDKVSVEEMVAAGEDMAKIETEIPDKITKEALINFAQSDQDFAALETNVQWFDSLPDEQTKMAIQVFRTVLETIDADKVRKEMEKANKVAVAQGRMNPADAIVTDEQVYAETARKAMVITKKYFGPGSQFAQQLQDTTAEAGGGTSLPITTAQLIELRMKGLDPAAAAQLDASSAAKILSATVKEQKNAISNLNMELRNNAIKSELLKSDQEVLQDTLSATSDVISSYIDSIQNVQIKPIQDQIDKYNELSQTQQDQIDLYQRGLQQISDKEDNINKAYDQRISAIDKVSQANERAAQSQQRQIDLATALTSGDIAAAAGAAADITAANAQIQLEDTRTALELQRQNEINNLTEEVNGKLYTRTQMETNIKTLEEDIYQRTLLVRQEQEKIANIEKTITAEKEKQRKLQVLSQITQLTQSIATTPNQTARQAMSAQIGYLGQSIGVDATNQAQMNTLGQSLGIELTGFAGMIAKSHETAQLTANEFTKTFLDVKTKVGDVSKFMSEGSDSARNSLGFLRGLESTWRGTTKVAGMESTGRNILDTLTQAAGAIRTGKDQIKAAVDAGVAAVKNAKPTLRYDVKTGKMVPAAFGGVIGYMGGGKVKRYAMGGNINYKGSTEPAPVRMAMGNIVPGLGNTDRIPALLTPGEFVVRKSVAKENMDFLKALNGDVFPQIPSSVSPNVDSSGTNVKNNILNNTPVYNYSVSVNVPNTNASPEDIANVVITKINRYQNNKVRGSRI